MPSARVPAAAGSVLYGVLDLGPGLLEVALGIGGPAGIAAGAGAAGAVAERAGGMSTL
jgi:hypothetical protein